ncbi:BRO-N domain-containing protein [Escherichia coli]|uniref:BRO-N domain-containing protein n=1 Tax=Escherichia coli TaxID=562 RepID=UPI002022F811|nr:Bro-N domain-containing protein [Escherichia coli]
MKKVRKLKNDEALTTCDSQGLLSNKSSEGNIDMNIVQNNDLTFHNTTFSYMEMAGQVWLTAAEVGQALEYADDKSVQRIFTRHADEFTEKMTGVVKLTTPRGMQESRVFSLRGAHLVAMFARTPKAKEFRRWVLDILDREVNNNMPVGNEPSARERHAYNVDALAQHYSLMYEAWKNQIYPALRAIESPLAGRLCDRFKDGAIFMMYVKKGADKQLEDGEVARIH